MSTAICPRCGLTNSGTDEQSVADTGIWAEESMRRCEHVHERRYLKDLRTHTCPHWAAAMQNAAEARDPSAVSIEVEIADQVTGRIAVGVPALGDRRYQDARQPRRRPHHRR